MIYLCRHCSLSIFLALCSRVPPILVVAILLATPRSSPLVLFPWMELATIGCCHHVNVLGTVKPCLVVVRSISFRVILIAT
jgi:hypothetical protein